MQRAERSPLTNGFTLLELMVVLLIVGIVLSSIALSVGDGGQRLQLEQEGKRLASKLTLTREETILNGELRALRFRQHCYSFMQRSGDKWLPMKESLLGPHELDEAIEITVTSEGFASTGAHLESDQLPQIYLLPSGELTEFSVRLALPGEGMAMQITANSWGEVSVVKEGL